LYYNALKCTYCLSRRDDGNKSYLNKIYTSTLLYIFEVQQWHGTKIPLRIHKGTQFQVKNSRSFWDGVWPLSRPLPAGRGTPSVPSTCRFQAFWIRPFVIPDFQPTPVTMITVIKDALYRNTGSYLSFSKRPAAILTSNLSFRSSLRSTSARLTVSGT